MSNFDVIIYRINSVLVLGVTIDKAPDNWGHKKAYGDEKDY